MRGPPRAGGQGMGVVRGVIHHGHVGHVVEDLAPPGPFGIHPGRLGPIGDRIEDPDRPAALGAAEVGLEQAQAAACAIEVPGPPVRQVLGERAFFEQTRGDRPHVLRQRSY